MMGKVGLYSLVKEFLEVAQEGELEANIEDESLLNQKNGKWQTPCSAI